MLSSLTAIASEKPEYSIEPVVNLCKAASNPANYTSNKLTSFEFLIDGLNNWVFRSKSDFIENFSENDSYSGLTRLSKVLESHGTRLVTVYYPTKGLIAAQNVPSSLFNYDKAKHSYLSKLLTLRQTGVLVPDFESLLTAESTRDELYFKRDIHWTPSGSKLLATHTANVLNHLPTLDFSQSNDVIITKLGSFPSTNSMSRAIKKLCHQQYITEYVQGYSYQERSSVNPDKQPQVVLLGSSLTNVPELNFTGFLKHELKIPIKSYTSSEDGLTGAWLKYIATNQFMNTPPKVVVWEIPPYYLLNDNKVFAQLVPLLEGGCDKRTSYVKQSMAQYDYSAGSVSTYFGPELESQELQNLIIELSIPASEVQNVEFKTWYSDGQVRKSKLSLSLQLGGIRRFAFELTDNLVTPSGSLIALELTSVNGVPATQYKNETKSGNVDLNICSKG